MKEPQVQSLVWEDPTGLGAAEPSGPQLPSLLALEPAPQQEEPPQGGACELRLERSCHNQRKAHGAAKDTFFFSVAKWIDLFSWNFTSASVSSVLS